jgi:hypothetical protein
MVARWSTPPGLATISCPFQTKYGGNHSYDSHCAGGVVAGAANTQIPKKLALAGIGLDEIRAGLELD